VATIGLVHGAYHGAWCWRELSPLLAAQGHRVVTVDLPSEDAEAGADAYARLVVERLGDEPDVVLVGHSLAGLTIPVVASLRPVRHLVYLCALLPRPGRSFDDVQAAEPVYAHYTPKVDGVANADGSASCPAARAVELFYHDCPPALADWAAGQLRRQHWRITREVTPLATPSTTPSTSIVCTEDRVIDLAWSRMAAQRELGVAPIELPGGHSPFLAQPGRLAQVLCDLAGAEATTPG
jgi:pimeloyl-ACP methyl ester carboxylesterase